MRKEVIGTRASKRISRLRLIALAERHPGFSKSIGLEVSLSSVLPTISKTHSFGEPSAAAAVGKSKGHD